MLLKRFVNEKGKSQCHYGCNFTHPDIRQGLLSTREILQSIYERGHVWISDVVLGKQERVLRACITSFHTTESDIECLLEEIEYGRQHKR